jgi:hypothetical protein
VSAQPASAQVLISLALFAACTRPLASTDGLSGTVDGRSQSFASGLARDLPTGGIAVDFADYAIECGDSTSRAVDGSHYVSIILPTASTVGAYTISALASPAGASITTWRAGSDGTRSPGSLVLDGKSVTIESISDEEVVGTADLVSGKAQLSGKFRAQRCPKLH